MILITEQTINFGIFILISPEGQGRTSITIPQGQEVMHRSCTYKRNQINLHALSSLPRPTTKMGTFKMFSPGQPTPAGV